LNKHRFKIIFNKDLGVLVIVAENVPSQGKGCGKASRTRVGSESKQDGILAALRTTLGTVLGLGLLAVQAQAQIVADPNAPSNQRPTVLTAPNNVPLVNIQTPSTAGVSRNTYSQFDVERQGAILNNSRTNTQTQLGGWVQGNPWLAGGGARVILNEVNSSNPSWLNGYIEIAGQRSEVVIANPSGINVDGGGFINASRSTLTTGTPVVSDGNLTGYQVRGGQITVGSQGFDASTTDYTDLIARSVQVNGVIWANQLKGTTGSNQVDADNTAATPISGTGPAPAFGIDVVQLGGMYAGKITLVGTEAGVGVRNAGALGAAAGEVVVTADGRLENSGRVTSSGTATLDSNTGIANSGTIYSQADTALSTRGDIANSGIIAAQGNTTLTATGTGSGISSTSGSVLGAGVQSDGSLGASGALTVQATKKVIAQGQNLAGLDQRISGSSLDLAGSQTSGRNLWLTAASGDLDLSASAISVSQTLTASASQALRTDHAVVTAGQFVTSAFSLSNVYGHLVQTGTFDWSLALTGDLDNSFGRIATNSRSLSISAATLTNTDGAIEHAGDTTLRITATTLTGQRGQIESNGLLALSVTTAQLDNGRTVAGQLDLATATLTNTNGLLAQIGSGVGSISATTLFDNTGGSLLGNGSLRLNAGDISNQGGSIQAAGTQTDLTLTATGRLDNSQGGNIGANGVASLTFRALDNTLGRITAALGADIKASQEVTNSQGNVAAGGQINLSASNIDNSGGIIGSVNEGLSLIATGSFNNSSGWIEAAKLINLSSFGLSNTDGAILGSSLTLNSQELAFDNTRGKVIATGSKDSGTLTLGSGALTVDAGLIQAKGQLAIDTHGQSLSNIHSGTTGGIIGQATGTSSLKLTTGDLDNSAGYLGAGGAITLSSAAITNTGGGLIIGSDQLRVSGSSFDNRGGQIQTIRDLDFTLSGVLNNSASLIRSGQTLSVTANSIVNTDTLGSGQGLEGNDVALTTITLDNRSGALRADNNVTVTSSGTVGNSSGLISAGQELTLRDQAAAKALAIINTSGTLIGGSLLRIDSASLSGDGNLLSRGNIDIALTSDYLHTGQLQANGNVDFTTTGQFVNRSALSAGQTLTLQAVGIDNQTNGTITAQTTNLIASNALTNRGLIDGGETWLAASTLYNLGTGRIYGDHVAIAAGTLTNDVENGVAPVIAARNRLDLGAGAITNREHALLFSGGDMAIGGGLDAAHQATGQASTLKNTSATIEALGSMAISAGQINNTNAHFSTAIMQVGSPETIDQYQLAPGSDFHPSDLVNRYAFNEVQLFDCEAQCMAILATGDASDNYNQYHYTRTISQTQVTATDPGKILTGGNLALTGNTLLNDKSLLIAGGAINANLNTMNNSETLGEYHLEDVGTVYLFRRQNVSGRDYSNVYPVSYQDSVVQTINIPITVYQQNTTPSGTGTAINNRSTGSVTQAPDSTGAFNAATASGQSVTPLTQVAALQGSTASGPALVVRSGGVNTTAPNNSLFVVTSDPSRHYLIETDPRFANYRQWLSSDYLLGALSCDPATTQKRLGDGFYEQKLVREQIAQLTGRRFLEGYASDEAEYMALMNNGATFAKQYNLRPGVALTPDQMASLTSDMVWLVEQAITLADGRTTQALVPQVYVRVREGDLTGSGALLSGDSVNLNLSGDLSNSGTIAGRTVVALTAENVQNLGGRIQGNDVAVQARTDLNTIGGSIRADNSLLATAGRDLNLITTTNSSANSQSERTNIDRVAGLYVTGGTGNLTALAGRDLNLTGAQVQNLGTGATVLSGGNNLNLSTVRESYRQNIVWDANNYHKEAGSTDIGATIQTQGDLRLSAGNDLNLKVASVTSDQGALLATAGKNVNLTTGEANVFYDDASQSTESGFFSSKTITTRDTLNQTTALGTTLSVDTAMVFAGKDINVLGGNVVSTKGTTLAAVGDINILSAASTSQQTDFKQEKESGLLSSGGIGFTIGTRKQSTDQQGVQTSAVAATIGSTEGDVQIAAGKNYTQVGSNVMAPQGNIDIEAQQVNILEARETGKSLTETRFEQSGLTIALTNPIITALQTAIQMKSAAQDTKDARMKVLAGASTVMAAKNAADAVASAPQGTASGFGISITVGGSQNKSTTTETVDTAAVSNVTAGKDISITARGAGKESDITLQGAQVAAGNNVRLQAEDELNLVAARSESDLKRESSGSSGGIGVAVQFGKGVAVGVTLNASGSQGKADGQDVSYTNSQVAAGNVATLESGGDTKLKGAVVAGKKVVADVGGNLNIESLQDSSVYASKDQSIGGSVTVGYGFAASGSYSNSKVDSNFASVGEQSGIKAGDGGFEVAVKGNTDLKGAVIASTDKAVVDGKNSFTTGSLTMSDIANHAEYDASGFSIGGGISVSGDSLKGGDRSGAGAKDSGASEDASKPGIGLMQMSNTPSGSAGVGSDSGSAGSITKSGISGIAGNKDVRIGDAETGITKIFDADKVQKEIDAQVQITQAFGQQASKAVGDYAIGQMKKAEALRRQADQLPADDPRRAELENQAKSLDDQWGEKGVLRLAAHTVIGGLTGGASGAAGAAAGTLTASAVDGQLTKAGITGPLADTLIGLASTAAGTAAGAATGGSVGATAGAATAFNEVENNYLKMKQWKELSDAKKQAAAKKASDDTKQAAREKVEALLKLDSDNNRNLVTKWEGDTAPEGKTAGDIASHNKTVDQLNALSEKLNMDPAVVAFTVMTIESTGRSDVYSNPEDESKAAGLYQQDAQTAKTLGLNVSSDNDERLDPEKAFEAAVSKLTNDSDAKNMKSFISDENIDGKTKLVLLYLSYQQGNVNNAINLFNNPDELASRYVSVGAVRGNIPDVLKQKAGTMTAGEFVNFIKNEKVDPLAATYNEMIKKGNYETIRR